MFRELIYTHCSQGIKINTGEKMSGNGFKVYACDSSLVRSVDIDVPFLDNAVAKKQTFDKNRFMDDAYLYYVPDSMESFLVSFHPFKPGNEQNDARYGKYINQVFIGNFSQMYPCETFRSPKIWDAKGRGLEHYYTSLPPVHLEAKEVFDDMEEKYVTVGSFISSERKESLKSIVAFLMAQFEKPVAERKYLVIVDESAENIENWISAVEYAFSPIISASIPFATRMDKFEKWNGYTINKINRNYEVNVNYQDPNQERRYRAMIVGVDSRDTSNVSNIRSMSNLSYVLFDGRKKEPLHDVNTGDSYFSLIVNFNDEHRQFCRIFLQGLKGLKKEPNVEIFKVYRLYTEFKKVSTINVYEAISLLDNLCYYEPDDTIFIFIYNIINRELERWVKENIHDVLELYNKHLMPMSNKAHDVNLHTRLIKSICGEFVNRLVQNRDIEAALSLMRSIEKNNNREFINALAETVANINIEMRKASFALAFTKMYLNSASIIGVPGEKIKSIVKAAFEVCFKDGCDKNIGSEILCLLSKRVIGCDIQDYAINVMREVDSNTANYILDCLMYVSKELLLTENAVVSFCSKLYEAELTYKANVVISKYIKGIRDIDTLSRFRKRIKAVSWLNDLQQSEIEGLIYMQVQQIVCGSANNFTSNHHTNELCKKLYKEGLGTSSLIKKIMLYRLREIKTADDITTFKTAEPLSWLTPDDLKEIENKIRDETDDIISREIKGNKSIFLSNESTERYCDILIKNNLSHFIKMVLAERLEIIRNSNRELLVFLDLLCKTIEKVTFSKNELKLFLEELDAKICIHDYDAKDASMALLRAESKFQLKLNLKLSIHIYAETILTDKEQRVNLIQNLESICKKYDFPSLTDEQYMRSFLELFLGVHPNEEEQEYVLNMFLNSHTKMCFFSCVTNLMLSAEKHIKLCEEFLMLIANNNTVSQNHDIIDNAIISAIRMYRVNEAGSFISLFANARTQEYLAKLIISKKVYPAKEINKQLLDKIGNEDVKTRIRIELGNSLSEEAQDIKKQKEEKRTNSLLRKLLSGIGRKDNNN